MNLSLYTGTISKSLYTHQFQRPMAIKMIMPIFRMIINMILEDILNEMDLSHSQYKSTMHYHHLQMLTNEKEKQVLKIWSIAGHGKGEVGCISGMTKISIKIAVSNDCFFDKSFKIY